ncbi:hypothetical protein [Myxococcus sp. RHSTA-1-4]|uniref:hypothetical protein n=1 Tax=Myxococcus sp. RHSTA-1-4 TaxID=2874601 RepID=UPI001CBE9D97|nr:hypothetical protein [Myxococcus sp. RHSTA-1-4]MBZ4416191.1 hypothetical protein [Myxococcus sp. RHSTA-1-4]
MGIHLTVISYPHTRHPMFEAVARAANNQLTAHKFVRCQKGSELRMAIKNSAVLGDDLRPRVTLLDLVGHGRAGYFELGDDVLVDGTRISAAVEELDHVLPRQATIRFLGCMTGTESTGLQMHKTLVKVLKREVLVATAALQPHHFGETGFKEDFRHLLSSGAREEAVRAFLPRPEPGAQEAAAPWSKVLPEGYEVVGRGHTAATVDFSIHHGGSTFTFAGNRQLVLVEDTPGQSPLLFQWNRSEAVPEPMVLLNRLTHRVQAGD